MMKKNEMTKKAMKLIDGDDCHLVVSDRGSSIYGTTPHLYGLFYELLKSFSKMETFDMATLDKVYKNAFKKDDHEIAEIIFAGLAKAHRNKN